MKYEIMAKRVGYFLDFLLNPARPIIPVPKRSIFGVSCGKTGGGISLRGLGWKIGKILRGERIIDMHWRASSHPPYPRVPLFETHETKHENGHYVNLGENESFCEIVISGDLT